MKNIIKVLASSIAIILLVGCSLSRIMGESDVISRKEMLQLYPDYKDCKIWDWERNICVEKIGGIKSK